MELLPHMDYTDAVQTENTKGITRGRKTKGHSLQPFIFLVIFLSLAEDSASFDFQVSM